MTNHVDISLMILNHMLFDIIVSDLISIVHKPFTKKLGQTHVSLRRRSLSVTTSEEIFRVKFLRSFKLLGTTITER